MPRFSPPVPRRAKLGNGLEVVHLERRGIPVVASGLVLRGGALGDPAAKSGLAHLTANLVFGAAFGYFAGQLFGTGLAWAGILLGGSLGNYLSAWLQGPGHRSIGASTAIFAALGLLSAFTWRRWRRPGEKLLKRWSPIFAGIALLAYTGAGGERTDVLAHLTGFVCGLLIGVAYGAAGKRILLSAPAQRILVLLALFALTLSWMLAIQSNLGRLI